MINHNECHELINHANWLFLKLHIILLINGPLLQATIMINILP